MRKDADEGDVKSLGKEEIFLPEIGWTYYNQEYFTKNDFDNCKTIG